MTLTDICLRKISDGVGTLPVVDPGPPPVTTCIRPVASGSATLPVASQNGFAIGQEVVLGKGTATEEYNRIKGFGSLILEFPLQFDHAPGLPIGIQ